MKQRMGTKRAKLRDNIRYIRGIKVDHGEKLPAKPAK